MPYLKLGRKKELMTEPKRASTDGDFNYLYTRAYLKTFTANPSYATIALIAKTSMTGRGIKEVEDLDWDLRTRFVPDLDVQTARFVAYVEFYARIGRLYEQYCITANGDLEEYKEAELAIQKKFAVEA